MEIRKKLRIFIMIIFCLPKTLYFNFRVFPFSVAIKLPVLISLNVKIKEIYRNCIDVRCSVIKPAMIKLGFGGSDAIISNGGLIFLNKKLGGKLAFYGAAKFSEGIRIFNNSGTIVFGNNFSANKNCFIASDGKIEFGNNVLLGWNISIRDSDGHTVIYDGSPKENIKEVLIGSNVWICANVNILKGTYIGDNNIISYGSIVIGLKSQNNMLIGGYPAKAIRENVDWKK